MTLIYKPLDVLCHEAEPRAVRQGNDAPWAMPRWRSFEDWLLTGARSAATRRPQWFAMAATLPWIRLDGAEADHLVGGDGYATEARVPGLQVNLNGRIST